VFPTASLSSVPANTSTSSARSGRARSRSSIRASTTRFLQREGRERPRQAAEEHPARRRISIYIASIGPKSVEQAAEIADGWLPIFFSPKRFNVYRPAVEGWVQEGRRRQEPEEFRCRAVGHVILGDDVASCLNFIKPVLALYIGGMGARRQELLQRPRLSLRLRVGREEDSGPLSGRKEERGPSPRCRRARGRDLALRPKERIRDRIAEWKESGITTMILALQQPEAMRAVAEAVL